MIIELLYIKKWYFVIFIILFVDNFIIFIDKYHRNIKIDAWYIYIYEHHEQKSD